MQKSKIKRLEAYEMRIWRGMLRISWIEYKKNDQVQITTSAFHKVV